MLLKKQDKINACEENMSVKDTNDLKSKKIKLNFVYPDNLKSNFVSNVIVQHQKDFFTLSFFEVWVPPILGNTEDEKKAELEKIDQVEANCVARLVVTPDKMRDFVKALHNNLENYDKIHSGLENND